MSYLNGSECGLAMLQFDEYKVKLNNIKPALDELAQAPEPARRRSRSWIC